MDSTFFAKVRKLEMQPVVFPSLANFNRLRRDVVSPEFAVPVHLKLQLPQYLTHPAACFAEGLGSKIVAL